MTKVNTHIAGWSLILCAVLGASQAFPALAETVKADRLETAQLARYEALQSANMPSDFAATLARDYVTQTSTARRDFSVTDDLLNLNRNDWADVKTASREKTCLAEAVYYEARSETLAGQKAVAEVVLNRVKSTVYPDTVCGVVYEGSERETGCQFTFTCDGSIDKAPSGKAWERSKEIADLVMKGGEAPVTRRATHYHTTEVSPVWSKNLRMTKHIGSHVFYRFAPRDYQVSAPMMLDMAPPS